MTVLFSFFWFVLVLEEGFLDSARNDGSFFVFLVCSCFGGGISRLCSK